MIMAMSKRQRDTFEGDPAEQIRENSTIKIMMHRVISH